MRKKIVQFRNLLERNKIFLEVLTASVLTITSIFVSIQANNIANQANKISSDQTDIMKRENTAKLEIRKTQLSGDSAQNGAVTKWSVLNNNSKISNFVIEKEFSYINVVKKLNTDEINIPVMEYINLEGKSTELNEGLIYEFDNKNCSYDELILRQAIWDFGFTQIKTFIQISFENMLTNEKETKFYQISPLIQPIQEKEWDSIKNDWSSKSKKVIYLKNTEKNARLIKDFH